ncbi:hypothetical protein DTO96_100777 [Ephemeroptericola cinctiostellae]|uniref:Uroporphyrinogen-III C-methyltransferase n=1 Tax=Ephemeroptericola cinctiostellae TaxID=2268024 RepID=A0A345D9M0_9BURK|nr:hypothetical protein [Ephemeroptericola cinctiostellae]AXF85058.1 hypothetical protein DTO96_100777 [Ephemeroptericola cinctiostellae]
MDKQENTSTTAPKKSSSFKRSVLWLLVLGVIGGSGYVAYDQGALDRYLPRVLQAKPAVEPAVAEVPATVDGKTEPSSSATAATGATQSDLQAALMQQMQQQVPPKEATANSSAVTPKAPVNGGATAPAPIVLAINGGSANALLTAYDAQWQWSNVQQSFMQHADSTLALQDLKNLKIQLQTANDPAFAPALSALAQTETQLQAWTAVPSTTYLTALQQTIAVVDQMDVKAKNDGSTTVNANLSWWERIVASMKNVIEVKKMDGAQEAQMLNPATAALVKQSISARLLSAQWAAQNGLWVSAQTNAAAAHALATQWADPAALSPIQGLIDNKSFPASPDFAAVSTALQQARAQLVSAARTQQSIPPVTPLPAPAAPSAPVSPAAPAAQKGGA